MNTVREHVPFHLVVYLVVLSGVWLPARSLAQAPDKAAALVGAWTLNQELSSAPPKNTPDAEGGGRDAGGRPGGGGRGGHGRGGFGGGGMGMGGGQRGGFGAGDGQANPEATARRREAMRDLMNPPAHLTIVSTGTMVVLTGPDGRTTRLSPDGSKITDENTKIERKTKWDGAKLVSEIGGLGSGKTSETYFVDGERHQLHVVAEMEGRGGAPARTITHVYDLDAR